MLAARHVPFYIISNNPVDGCLMKLERAGLLGTWRVMVQNSLFIFIPVCAIAFFTNPQFATGPEKSMPCSKRSPILRSAPR